MLSGEQQQDNLKNNAKTTKMSWSGQLLGGTQVKSQDITSVASPETSVQY